MTMDETPITRFTGEYAFLSNFHRCQVEYAGAIYPSSENAYQAAKCANPIDREQFLHVTSAKAKALGKRVKMDPRFNSGKLAVMSNLLQDKFTRNVDLRQLLLDTGDRELIEGNHWHDRYWGQCPIGKGHNHLGRLLMIVRRQIKEGTI